MSKQKKDINTEGRILNAAKSIFHKKGMDGARMQEIADAAGINKAMLHYYYRNKQLLFEAVFTNAIALLAPQLEEILNSNITIEEKVHNFTDNYISFISEHPYLPGFIIQEINRNPQFFEKIKENGHLPNLEFFDAQVSLEVKNGTIKQVDGKQLFVNILSLNIFPFMASPLFKAILQIDTLAYQKLMEERKIAVSEFIINSIKK